MAAVQCNLILDIAQFDNTWNWYLSNGGLEAVHRLYKELNRLDFETLVELMNSKIEYTNLH
jgi:LPS sulfotransferase NodH